MCIRKTIIYVLIIVGLYVKRDKCSTRKHAKDMLYTIIVMACMA